MRAVILIAILLLAGGTATADESPDSVELWLEAHRSPDQTKYFGQPIDLSLRDADLVEVLRSFAEIGGFNMVIQPGIHGKVTVELKGVPWDQALEQILKINNLGMEVTGGRVDVGARSERTVESLAASMLTVSLELKHADPAVVARALSRPAAGVPSPGGAIRAEDGKLVIRDTRPMLLLFGEVLADVDVPAAAGEGAVSLARRCVEAWDQLAP